MKKAEAKLLIQRNLFSKERKQPRSLIAWLRQVLQRPDNEWVKTLSPGNVEALIEVHDGLTKIRMKIEKQNEAEVPRNIPSLTRLETPKSPEELAE